MPTFCTYYSHTVMTKILLKKQLKGSSVYWAHGRSRLVHGGSKVVLVTLHILVDQGAEISDSIGHHHTLKSCLSVSPSKAPLHTGYTIFQNSTITQGPIIQTHKPGKGKFHIQTETGTFQDCTNISTIHPQNFFIIPNSSFVTTR